MNRGFFLFLLGMGVVTGAVAKKAAGPKDVFLYEHGNSRSRLVEGNPKSNRLHVRYSAEFSDWVFVLTDAHGHFADPMEVLVAGSVVLGEQIGAAGGQSYQFQSGGRWSSTAESRRLRLIVLAPIPTYKTVTFEPATGARPEFVNPEYKVNFKTFDPFARP